VPALSQVFSEHPHLTVLTLSPDGREITLHHLKVESLRLPAVPTDSVAGEIRTALRYDCLDN
jgi:hypothetical protein